MENHSATSATTLKYNTGKRIRCGKKGKVGGGCIVIEKVEKVGCEDGPENRGGQIQKTQQTKIKNTQRRQAVF